MKKSYLSKVHTNILVTPLLVDVHHESVAHTCRNVCILALGYLLVAKYVFHIFSNFDMIAGTSSLKTADAT